MRLENFMNEPQNWGTLYQFPSTGIRDAHHDTTSTDCFILDPVDMIFFCYWLCSILDEIIHEDILDGETISSNSFDIGYNLNISTVTVNMLYSSHKLKHQYIFHNVFTHVTDYVPCHYLSLFNNWHSFTDLVV